LVIVLGSRGKEAEGPLGTGLGSPSLGMERRYRHTLFGTGSEKSKNGGCVRARLKALLVSFRATC
jgi:hypothetical protein